MQNRIEEMMDTNLCSQSLVFNLMKHSSVFSYCLDKMRDSKKEHNETVADGTVEVSEENFE